LTADDFKGMIPTPSIPLSDFFNDKPKPTKVPIPTSERRATSLLGPTTSANRPTQLLPQTEDLPRITTATVEWPEIGSIHFHINEDGTKYECDNIGCNLFFWQDEVAKKAIPERLRSWVGRDLIKAMVAMELQLKEDIDLLTGPTATVGGKRFRIWKILAITFAILGTGVAGAFFGDIAEVGSEIMTIITFW